MAKMVMHWQLGAPASAEEAHFFLYQEGAEVHCDHRLYSRDELERRVAAIRAGSGSVPPYYQAALAALEDPQAPRCGEVPIGTD
jgi:hypothetical protein